MSRRSDIRRGNNHPTLDFRVGARQGGGIAQLSRMNIPSTLPPLILASASPRRAELLREQGLAFAVVTSEVDEVTPEGLSPRELCQLNAHQKACAVARRHPDALVLGADTLVFLGSEILGKPADLEAARRMLHQLQGRTHEVVTGVSLLQWCPRREQLFAVSTRVRFRALSAAQIESYLAAVHTLDKAGAYAIQEHGEWLVETIDGSFTNVVGLPVEQVAAAIQAWNSTGA